MKLFGSRGADAAHREAAKQVAGAVGERALAWAATDDGALLVATDRALHVGEERLPWDRVAKAGWDSDEGVLTVVASSGPGERSRSRRLAVGDATRLLQVVRSMVTSNLVVSERIASPEWGGAWVTARRDPDADLRGRRDAELAPGLAPEVGGLRWTVVFDPGLDPTDPGRRAWADENVAAIRRSTGV